jgi:hypothetical protein
MEYLHDAFAFQNHAFVEGQQSLTLGQEVCATPNAIEDSTRDTEKDHFHGRAGQISVIVAIRFGSLWELSSTELSHG